ncbi:MAG: hypothetical protein Q8J96_06865 [Rhodocyclaceae bacterium]|nr:hypothetical protein [Rhodocyclaceae bacterium]
MSLNESIVENTASEWFNELGRAIGHWPGSTGTTKTLAQGMA